MNFDAIGLEIMWSRLISVADEMWTTVLRTAVSPIIGAAQDFGCEILDANGNSVAHATRSMPVFNMVMPRLTRAILAEFPLETMQPGDVYVTNDPWICAGHLDDVGTVTPIFIDETIVAFAATVAHSSSVGGSLAGRAVRDLHEEGLRIPISKLYDAGEPNRTVFRFLEDNVRTPEMVFADIEAQVIANEVGARRVVEFLREYRLGALTPVAEIITQRAELAMRNALDTLRDGVYENEIQTDGVDKPVRLCCRVTIRGSGIEIDYVGSDPQTLAGGINCTFSYTHAHTIYPLKCLLSPEVPANEGTFRPVTVKAPRGCILNCIPPASVGARTRTGWHLHGLLFGALERVLPDAVQAGSGLMQWFRVYARDNDGRVSSSHFIAGGGRGASAGFDGAGRDCYPSSARNVPVELFELRVPVIVEKRSLRVGSAGWGQWRGAFGHELEFVPRGDFGSVVSFFLDPDHVRFPPRGRAGGGDGALLEVFVNGRRASAADIRAGVFSLDGSDRLTLHVPGGGGFGSPSRRERALVLTDWESELISDEEGRLETGSSGRFVEPEMRADDPH